MRLKDLYRFNETEYERIYKDIETIYDNLKINAQYEIRTPYINGINEDWDFKEPNEWTFEDVKSVGDDVEITLTYDYSNEIDTNTGTESFSDILYATLTYGNHNFETHSDGSEKDLGENGVDIVSLSSVDYPNIDNVDLDGISESDFEDEEE